MLEIHQLSRRFGERTVLDQVSFSVRPGRMTGFVGANGAGKTTTMRIVMGVLAASAGDVTWQGHEITRADRTRFGYMPEERGLYPKQPVVDQLVFFARLHGSSAVDARARAQDLLDRLGLADRAHDKLESLSLGNQQRVQIAAAVIHRPVALVLDEPFSGLDPLAVDAMTDMLREHLADGVPVIFSSHQLDLVERLCDDLVILADGRVVSQGTPEQLRAAASEPTYRLVLGGDAGWVRGLRGLHVKDVDGGRALVDVVEPGAEQVLLREALERDRVLEMSRVVPSLSELFREVIR